VKARSPVKESDKNHSESFFISHIRQGLRPADPAVLMWKFLT
jgi:hypothetical protein